MVSLEVPFDYGRWLISTALTQQRNEASEPLRGEYTLYNDLIWQFDPPQVDESVKAFFQRTPTPAIDVATLDAYAAALLAHPALEGWHLQNRAAFQTPQTNTVSGHWAGVRGCYLLHELDQWPEKVRLLAAVDAGLRAAQAAWLHYLGETESAHRPRAGRPDATGSAHTKPLAGTLIGRRDQQKLTLAERLTFDFLINLVYSFGTNCNP